MAKKKRKTPRAHLVRPRNRRNHLRGIGKPSLVFVIVFTSLVLYAVVQHAALMP